MYPSDLYKLDKTDHSRWRLHTDELGRQTWHYLSTQEAAQEPASVFTQYQLNTNDALPRYERAETAKEAARYCMRALAQLQEPDSGHFPCQYGGPLFLIGGYVVAKYYCGVPYGDEERKELTRYLINRAHPVDGGWGLHTYDKSTVFGTALNYVVLRLLGMDANHAALVRARRTLHAMGGALGIPHWGKAYLSVLNVYDWSGVNGCPGELWLLPYKFNWLHPGRWWVHTRAIYLTLGYLYNNKCRAEPLTQLQKELRQELYVQKYDTIDFPAHRNTISAVDLYVPHSGILKAVNWALAIYDRVRPAWLHTLTNEYMMELILKDLQNTDHLAIAPISNVMSAMSVYHYYGRTRDTPAFQRFLYRWPDFMFMSPEGLMMNGTNGVQVWDAAFVLQYCVEAGLAAEPEFRVCIERAFRFLLRSQITHETVPGSFRDKRRGAWPFSTKTQGFPVSDCTAEAIKALLMVVELPEFKYLESEIDVPLLFEGVDVLLNIQNIGGVHNGAFGTYEKAKSTFLLELLNPAEVFANIMVEQPYVECTDSSVLGLTYFQKHYDYRQKDIERAISLAIDYIVKAQDPDTGSWYGCWGCCHTYAAMFAMEALATQSRSYHNCPVVRRGCEFLVRRQESDGGWAENFRSCELHTYVRDVQSGVVQTAWALLALLFARYPHEQVLSRAAAFIMSKQCPNGTFPWNHVEGVFNHSCAIEYPNYRLFFTMKALGLYDKAMKKQK